MNRNETQKLERLGEERTNKQGCAMKIVEYKNYDDIIVEFQDSYKVKIHTTYNNFKKLNVKNPYFPTVFGVGAVGVKYKTRNVLTNHSMTKEYVAWNNMLKRCYDKELKNKHKTYDDVICCKEWLLFENFYEWLHNQENFDKWYNGKMWAVDKDIIKKGNKIYSPDTCCLVPDNVNKLFTKHDNNKNSRPVGVNAVGDIFWVRCRNPFTKTEEYLGSYNTAEKAFYVYKKYKENNIKKMAQIEFDNKNITKKCYNAMMNYKVDIIN